MDKLRSLPIWVMYKKEPVQTPGNDGNKTQRFTKIPYQTNGQKASSVDPRQWTTFENAQRFIEHFSGIGFTISKEFPLLCIDLDHVLKDDEITRDDLYILLQACNTYTEKSPSGDGLHIIFELEQHFSLVTNKKVNDDGTAIEVYTEGRYFTYTGNKYKDSSDTVRKIGQEEALELLRMVGYPWGKTAEVQPQIAPEQVTYSMPNEKLLEKMFKSKGGTRLKRLYDGDIKDYNNDASAADAALITQLAFWTNKNYAQTEEMWLASPLGQREKTQQRKDYRDRTINNVFATVTETYKPQAVGSLVKKDAPIQPTFIKEIKLDGENNPKGIPHKNIPNVEKIISADSYLANSFRYNSFSDLFETNIDNGSDWVPLEPRHITDITKYIQDVYTHFENLTQATVDQAIVVYAVHKKVNPPKDLITSTKWDGVARIDTWLTSVFGVEESPLINAIASNWMKGLVNRVCTPGCQFDTVLVLEGSQGIGKSSALRALSEPWYAETTIDVDQKDFQLILMQNIVVEFSEGASLSRSEMSNMKQTITARDDNFRRPYDRHPGKYKRRCVFAMTTNESQYLKDETGNRRWLPVALPNQQADIDWIHENRVQLFAEAYHRVYELNEPTHIFPQEELEIAQAERMEEDPWIGAIIRWYFDECTDQQREDGVTTTEAYSKALWEITRKDFTAGQSQRVAAIFKTHLKLERVKRKKNNVGTWRYIKTEETDKLNDVRLEHLTQTEAQEKATLEARKFFEKGHVPSPIQAPQVNNDDF